LPELHETEFAIWYLRNLSLLGWLKLLPSLYRGKSAGEVEICSGVVHIFASKNVKIEYDGDPHGSLPLTIRVASQKLNLIAGE